MIGALEAAIKEENHQFMREYFGKAKEIAQKKMSMYQEVIRIIDENQAAFYK